MNYGEIKTNDIANGEGIRLSLFVSGCRNHCKGCFNQETWDFNYGYEFTHKTVQYIIDELSKSQYQGITILGGDPLEPENLEDVCGLCEYIKEKLPNKDIWLYTGYTIEELFDKFIMNYKKEKTGDSFILLQWYLIILNYVDVIVDGKFIEELKDLTLKFRGSSNQRVIDMNKSRKNKKIVLWKS